MGKPYIKLTLIDPAPCVEPVVYVLSSEIVARSLADRHRRNVAGGVAVLEYPDPDKRKKGGRHGEMVEPKAR